jgi:2-oxoisovalerate ferredoxin oxidoreductase delta subunit
MGLSAKSQNINRKGDKIIFDKVEEMPLASISVGDMGWNRTGSWRSVKPIIDYEACINCMQCWKSCPDVSIRIEEETPVINYTYCKGCGICAEECPVDAITLEREVK